MLDMWERMAGLLYMDFVMAVDERWAGKGLSGMGVGFGVRKKEGRAAMGWVGSALDGDAVSETEARKSYQDPRSTMKLWCSVRGRKEGHREGVRGVCAFACVKEHLGDWWVASAALLLQGGKGTALLLCQNHVVLGRRYTCLVRKPGTEACTTKDLAGGQQKQPQALHFLPVGTHAASFL